jgi:hypothetical protein
VGLQTDCESIFAGHQTFHPRFGWVKKAFDGANTDPQIFNREDATVRLGVGKNMVDAIRFWGLALKVIKRTAASGAKRENLTTPTHFGSALFDSTTGLDPYVENPSTLWLLHWQALSAHSSLPIWRIFFNEYSAVEFTGAEFLRFVDEQLSGTTWKKPVLASIEKDFDCLIRMYSRKAARGRQTIDDLMDSPFRQLGLVIPSPSGPDAFRFALGEKPFLTDEVIVYASLDYLARTDSNSKTITTTRLTSDSGSPGRLFKISEERLNTALENCVTYVDGLEIASPAGATQLVVDGDINEIALLTLQHLYKVNKSSVKRIHGPVIGLDALASEQELSFSLTRGKAS